MSETAFRQARAPWREKAAAAGASRILKYQLQEVEVTQIIHFKLSNVETQKSSCFSQMCK